MARQFLFNRSHMNIVTKANILKAIATVKAGRSVEHVRNIKGHAYLAVRKAPSGLVSVTNKAGKSVKNDLLAWNGAGSTRTFRHYIHDNVSNLY